MKYNFFSILIALCFLALQMEPLSAAIKDDPKKQLARIVELSEMIKESASNAESAESVLELKNEIDGVVQAVWGFSSGLGEKDYKGASNQHGWKTRWQTTYTDFGPKYYKRYSQEPPLNTDPNQLGLIGIGRDLRKNWLSVAEDSTRGEEERMAHKSAIATLNNIIGWMKMEVGNIKAEDQPRVDLTRVWNAPKEFWNSTADTGWIQEVYAQALNIQKTNYGTDIAMAKKHVADLITLMSKVEDGVDADGDGLVEARMMEGGLKQLKAQAMTLGS